MCKGVSYTLTFRDHFLKIKIHKLRWIVIDINKIYLHQGFIVIWWLTFVLGHHKKCMHWNVLIIKFLVYFDLTIKMIDRKKFLVITTAKTVGDFTIGAKVLIWCTYSQAITSSPVLMFSGIFLEYSLLTSVTVIRTVTWPVLGGDALLLTWTLREYCCTVSRSRCLPIVIEPLLWPIANALLTPLLLMML